MPSKEIWQQFETSGKEAGFTQKQLAEMVGVSPRYFRKLKTGERSGSQIAERKHTQAGLYQVKVKLGRKKTISRYVRVPESSVGAFVTGTGMKLGEKIAGYQEQYATEGDYQRPRISFTSRRPVSDVVVEAL